MTPLLAVFLPARTVGLGSSSRQHFCWRLRGEPNGAGLPLVALEFPAGATVESRCAPPRRQMK